MRLIVFFDLPVKTAKQRKEYRLFRKKLLKEGYLMLQKSVYSKLSTNEQTTESALKRLKNFKPPEGVVQVLKVTEKQYATMTYVTGEYKMHEEVNSTDEVLII